MNRQYLVKERILAAGMDLFATKGYDRTRTAEIAKLARSSESQLVKYYETKEKLLLAVFDDLWDKIHTQLPSSSRDVGKTVPGKLWTLLDTVLRVLDENPQLKKIMVSEGRCMRSGEFRVNQSQGFQSFQYLFHQILLEMGGHAKGKTWGNPQAISSAIWGATEGLIGDQMLGHRADDTPAFSDAELRETLMKVVTALTKPS